MNTIQNTFGLAGTIVLAAFGVYAIIALLVSWYRFNKFYKDTTLTDTFEKAFIALLTAYTARKRRGFLGLWQHAYRKHLEYCHRRTIEEIDKMQEFLGGIRTGSFWAQWLNIRDRAYCSPEKGKPGRALRPHYLGIEGFFPLEYIRDRILKLLMQYIVNTMEKQGLKAADKEIYDILYKFGEREYVPGTWYPIPIREYFMIYFFEAYKKKVAHALHSYYTEYAGKNQNEETRLKHLEYLVKESQIVQYITTHDTSMYKQKGHFFRERERILAAQAERETDPSRFALLCDQIGNKGIVKQLKAKKKFAMAK